MTSSALESLWLEAELATASELTDEQSLPLTWASPSPSTSPPSPSSLPLSPAVLPIEGMALPNAGALEIRRMKNRECMRRARQRQREDLARMKETVARLESQYVELCVRAAPAIDDAIASTSAKEEHKKQQRQYAAALELAKRLGAENLFLKAGLQQHAAWKQHLHRIMDSMADSYGEFNAVMRTFEPSAASSLLSASARTTAKPGSVSAAMALNLNVLDAQEAETLFGFSPLDESAVSRAIVDNALETQKIHTSLLDAAEAKDVRANRRDVLGWDVIQRVRGSLMEYMFTKTFTDLDVHEAGQKMWINDMQVDNFRRVKYDVRRLEVLQVVSANAYILGRDVNAPDRSTVFRSLFMRFRTQVNREIPNGSQPPLKATGFVIGSHSLNRDWSCASSSPRYSSYLPGSGAQPPAGVHDGESLEWADLALTTEFLTIEDPATGRTHHQIRWIGRTDYKSQADALRNAPDTLTVCLRTEMLMFRPALRVIDSGAAAD